MEKKLIDRQVFLGAKAIQLLLLYISSNYEVLLLRTLIFLYERIKPGTKINNTALSKSKKQKGLERKPKGSPLNRIRL